MIRYNIRVNTGDCNQTKVYYFVHKNWDTISQKESDEKFNEAVQEIDRIYKTYGRFATETGVSNLFAKYGFERTPKD